MSVPGRNRGHRLDRPVARVDGDDRRRRIAAVVERLANRSVGGALKAAVDRRVDLEPARANRPGPVLLDELVAHVAEEVRLPDAGVDLARPQVQVRDLAPLLVRGVVDVAVLVERLEHSVPPLDREGRVVERVVVGRRLRKAGQEGRLKQRQLPRRTGEVGLGRSLDAVRVVPVVDGVHVLIEDLVLRPVVAEPHGEARLDELPAERPLLVSDVEVADQLLRDRRAALDDAAGADITEEGAADRLEVDAAVTVEAAVLDRDRRSLHPRADVGQRHGLAVLLGGDRPEHRPVRGVHKRVLAECCGLELVQRAVAPDRGGAAEPDRDRCDGSADDHDGKDREPTTAPSLLASALAAVVGELRSSACAPARAVGRRAHSTP